MRPKSVLMVAVVGLLIFPHKRATAEIAPYLPPGSNLPGVGLPMGVENPNLLPKQPGKVTLNLTVRAEHGLRLNLKPFFTDPQDRSLHWQMRSVPPEELATARIPIKGSLDTLEGLTMGPMLVEPGTSRLITLVVDNRHGEEEQQFYVPSPNPKVDFHLSSDTDPDILFKVVPQCFCSSHVYTVPKGGIWYRVVRIAVAPDAPTPSRATFIMDLMKAPRAVGHSLAVGHH